MISILPIKNTGFIQKQLLLKLQNKPLLDEKADSFECTEPSFKGGEINLHLPVKEIEELLTVTYEKIRKTSDIFEKHKFTEEYSEIFHKITSSAIGITEGKDRFPKDREHHCFAPIKEFYTNFKFWDIKDGASAPNCLPEEYDKAFKYMGERTLDIIKNWEYLLDNGFDTNSMSPQNVFKLALSSASKKAEHNKVKIKISGAKLLDKYDKQIQHSIPNYDLHNIFSNLVENAVKYTQKGSTVNIKFNKQRLKDNYNYLVFSVKDKGIGIPVKDQEMILLGSPKRAQNAIESGIEGTGYGLRSIVMSARTELKIKSPLNPFSKKYPGTEVKAYIFLRDEK